MARAVITAWAIFAMSITSFLRALWPVGHQTQRAPRRRERGADARPAVIVREGEAVAVDDDPQDRFDQLQGQRGRGAGMRPPPERDEGLPILVSGPALRPEGG